MDPRVSVESVNGRQDFILRGFGRQVRGIAEQSGLSAGPLLVGYVDRRGGVVAHQHHRQTRGNAVLFLHLDDAERDLAAYPRRQSGSRQNLGRHPLYPSDNDWRNCNTVPVWEPANPSAWPDPT